MLVLSSRVKGEKSLKSDTLNVESIFKDRRQYRVPFFQRHYVWNLDEQWEPLWSDIVTKATSRTLGMIPAPHFLGAIVLEPQPRYGLRGVETLHIIDGQQRLTTLQYVLAALLIIARETKTQSIATLVSECVANSNPDTMLEPTVEVHKVWPTFRDRPAYTQAMAAASREDLRAAFPMHFTQQGALKKIGIIHPPILAAIWYFASQIEIWIRGQNTADALERLAEAILKDLKIVSITLEEQDDAQVIFETLNGRGAELHATDLIRNFIFMRAERDTDQSASNGQSPADPVTLYDTLWREFEGGFWSEEQRRGRLNRPRLEWFMQTALQAEASDEVDIGTLYASYRNFAKPLTAQRQLEILKVSALEYRELLAPNGNSPIAEFGRAIGVWDASPIHPLALRIARGNLSATAQSEMYSIIMSYVVRRAICGLTNKSYNKIFLQLLKSLHGEALSPQRLRDDLAVLKGDASRWPADDELLRAFLSVKIYKEIGEAGRLRAILTALENGLRSHRSEEPKYTDTGNVDIDHIMPDQWFEHWPIEGASVTPQEVDGAVMADLLGTVAGREAAIARREKLKHTIGNLTLLHYGANRSLRNKGFGEKKRVLFDVSNLHLNRPLMISESWNEDAIEDRSKALFEVAKTIWVGPPS